VRTARRLAPCTIGAVGHCHVQLTFPRWARSRLGGCLVGARPGAAEAGFATGVFIDGTTLADAVDYGALKTHEKGHPDFWAELQQKCRVPHDEEYDEVPRGRVTYDTRRQVYLLFLDRCIRNRPETVSKIMEILHLPPSPATEMLSDSHYQCPACMRSRKSDEDEEWQPNSGFSI
jgi:hypothetical protein